MRNFVYCIAHILFSSIVFFTLFFSFVFLLINKFFELYFEDEIINLVIFLVIFVLILLVSFFSGRKISFWLRQKSKFNNTITLVVLLALINLGLVFTLGAGNLLVLETKETKDLTTLEKLADRRSASKKKLAERRSYLPEFPLPAPPASATIILPSYFFKTKAKANEEAIYLKDIAQILNNSLVAAGYFEKSYFAVPDGFAIVTRLEQINFDGTPKQSSERWATVVEPLRKLSLRRYLEALFTANPGYYRIIVFIVTPHPFSQTAPEINRDEAEAWLRKGVNTLPKSIGQQIYSSDYNITALIYEFEQPSGFEEDKVNIIIPGRLDAKSHLLKAGLWNALEK